MGLEACESREILACQNLKMFERDDKRAEKGQVFQESVAEALDLLKSK